MLNLRLRYAKDPLSPEEVLKNVGLENRMHNFRLNFRAANNSVFPLPARLPKIRKCSLCDEPTGALDYNTGKSGAETLQDTCRKTGMTVIVITHNQALTAMADRVIKIKNGKVEYARKPRARGRYES